MAPVASEATWNVGPEPNAIPSAANPSGREMTSGNIPTFAELCTAYGDVGTSLVQAPRPMRRGRTTGITAFVSERIVDLLSEVCGA
jgi:hypothetical protein